MRLNISNIKQNFSSFLHQNKGAIVGLALAILSVMPLKSFSNELKEASAATKAATETAIAPYHQNISIPDSAEVWYEKGKAAYEKDQYDEAIKCYEKAIELNPNYAEAYNSLGYAYLAGRQGYDKAEEYFLKAFDLDPFYVTGYTNLGNLYLIREGDYEKAIEYNYNAIKYLDEATEYYSRRTRFSSVDKRFIISYVFVYFSLGQIYQKYKPDYDKAIEYYGKAVELNPNYAEAYFNLGNLYLKYKQDYDKAIECYGEARFFREAAAEVNYNLGYAYQIGKQDYDKAIKYYEKTIKYDPDYMDAYIGLGDIYQQQGEASKAIRFYKKASTLGDARSKQWLLDNNITW